MGYAAAPSGQGLVGQAAAAAGGTVYVPAAKRQKKAEDKAAAAERKRQLQVRWGAVPVGDGGCATEGGCHTSRCGLLGNEGASGQPHNCYSYP